MTSKERTLYTGILLSDTTEAVPAAIVKVRREGQFESSSLAYGRNYLNRAGSTAINPATLPLQNTTFLTDSRRLRDGGGLPLTLQDALPDTWGRLVLQATNQWQQVDDIDALLQTNHDRVGALVFHTNPEMTQLPLAVEAHSLSDLAKAAHGLEFGMEVPDKLRRLLRQGGSLGGARPKASLWTKHGLWLAKFPARDDEVDVQLLEAATLSLAAACGIRVPEFRVDKIGKVNAILLRRFDRPGTHPAGPRIHYLSAAAFTDSPYEGNSGSYVKLAETLRIHGSDVARDLEQLFRRMVFNMLIDNSDDHVKNHGVLHSGNNRYRLSPAFDLVPQLTNLGYTGMAIANEQSDANLQVALNHAPQFGLDLTRANEIISTLRSTLREWKPFFEKMGADVKLLKRVSACFERQNALVTR